jgi:hypothetical protein
MIRAAARAMEIVECCSADASAHVLVAADDWLVDRETCGVKL